MPNKLYKEQVHFGDCVSSERFCCCFIFAKLINLVSGFL